MKRIIGTALLLTAAVLAFTACSRPDEDLEYASSSWGIASYQSKADRPTADAFSPVETFTDLQAEE